MRAFLVIGPESSGTKLMTKLLLAAGCEGDDGDEQRWDRESPQGDLIVWRRSLPHGGEWPNLSALANSLGRLGYQVKLIVMSRDWHAMSLSQVQAGHVSETHETLVHIREAYFRICTMIAVTGYPFEIVNYETLIRPGGEAIERLMERLELVMDKPVHVYDGDAKHYNFWRPIYEQI